MNITPNNATYIPALDGFRGIAILLVVIGHWGFGQYLPGGFGVNLFFFISGFLITRLMINEHKKNGKVDLKNFYARRMLRLYPALIFMLAVSVSYTVLIGCQVSLNDILSTLFYYRNYYMIYGKPDVSFQCSKVYGIVWSLAVEEHFYIIFPVLFLLLYKRLVYLVTTIAVLLVGVLLWRFYIVDTQGISSLVVERIYRLTDTRADAILYGCLLSIIMDSSIKDAYMRFVSHKLTFTIAVLILLFTFVYRDLAFRETYRYSLQGLVFLCLIPAVLYARTYKHLLTIFNHSVLTYIGKISYSLYMFHWVGVCLAEYYVGPERGGFSWLAIAIPVGLGLTLISFYFVEKPMIAIRKRFGSNVQADNTHLTNDSLKTIPNTVSPA